MRPSILHNRASSARPLFQHSGTNVAKDAAPGPTHKHHIHKHAHCQSDPSRSRMYRKLARLAVGSPRASERPFSRTVPSGASRSRVQRIDRLQSSYLPNEHTIHRVDHCASAAGGASRLGSSGGHAGHVLARAVRGRVNLAQMPLLRSARSQRAAISSASFVSSIPPPPPTTLAAARRP